MNIVRFFRKIFCIGLSLFSVSIMHAVLTVTNDTREPLKLRINSELKFSTRILPTPAEELGEDVLDGDSSEDLATRLLEMSITPRKRTTTVDPFKQPLQPETIVTNIGPHEKRQYQISSPPSSLRRVITSVQAARVSDEEDTTIATAPVPDEVIVKRADFLTPEDRLRLFVMEEMLSERKRPPGTIHNETPSDVTVIFRNLQNPAALNSLIVPSKSTAFFPASSAIIYGIESDTSVDTTALPTGTIPTDALTELRIEDVPYYRQFTQGLLQGVARIAGLNRTVPPVITPENIPNFSQNIIATNTTNVPVRVELPGALDELPVITVTLPPYGPNSQSVNVHGVHSGLRGAPIPSVPVFSSTWYRAGKDDGQRHAIFREGQLTIE